MNSFITIFSYSFMLRALITGILIAICSSLIGTSLVLRRNSMIGDGLSHVAFGAFAIATVFNYSPIIFTIPIVIIVSFLILRLNENNKIHGDSLIAIVSISALAIGTFLISINKGVNTDISNFLFGSILSIDKLDLILSIVLSLFVIVMFIFSYNKIFLITFDEKFAKSIGINTNLYNVIFAIICSLVIVVGMRLMGALLISSLIIFPTLTTMQVINKFKSVIISSTIVSVVAFILGLYFSFILESPTGSTIVIVNLIFFLLFKIYSIISKKFTI